MKNLRFGYLRDLVYAIVDLFYFWAVAFRDWMFGIKSQVYKAGVEFKVNLKANFDSIYQRAIYKELRFFHS